MIKGGMIEALRFLLPLIFVMTAAGAERTDCGSIKSKLLPYPVGYCAVLPPGYDAHPEKKYPVLYFLHGLGGDQTFMVASGAWNVVADGWERKSLGEFVIITPQAGRSFYINSKDGRARYDDFFVRDFIPQMEKRYHLMGTRAGRAIGGVSMGGYGALRFAFKYPQMFSVVAVHMPALLEQLPRGAANAGLSGYLGGAFGTPINEAFWKANTPFVYARTAALQGMKIYADCGDRDDFGFEAGTRQLDRLLTQRKIVHTIHIYPGSHSPEFVAEHLGESMGFVSRGLGLTK
jgi:S-formylglutathione hydrolase FrmB